MFNLIEVITSMGIDANTFRTCFSVIVPFVVSLALGWLFVPRVLLLSRKKHLYDIPDYRKLHTSPIPRLGGVTFFPVLLMSFCLTVGFWILFSMDGVLADVDSYMARFILLTVGMMGLFLTGVTDDLIGVSYQAKFVVQFLCAMLFPLSGLWLNDFSGLFWLHTIPAWLGVAITVFLIVYVMNAVNLIDGVDGLASGLCSIALFTFGLAAAMKGQYLFCMASFGMLGVLIPFWFYNVFGSADRGKKIFMGDTGSLTLGFLLSFLIVYLSGLDKDSSPKGMLLIGLSTLLIPLMDIPRVMLARIRQGRNPFTPDTNHIHHKLMRAGLSPKCTMAFLLGASAFLVAFTILLIHLGCDLTLILLLEVALDVALHIAINHFIAKKER